MQHSVVRRGQRGSTTSPSSRFLRNFKHPSRITPRKNYALRGLAPVVGIALLISLGVIAVVGLGVFVMQLVDDPQLSPTVSCFDAQAESPLVLSTVCYNQTSKIARIEMYRIATPFVYDSLLFTLVGTTSSSWVCGEGCGLCSLGNEGTSKTYYSLPLDATPSLLQVFANGCELASASVQNC